jgi:CHRD domain
MFKKVAAAAAAVGVAGFIAAAAVAGDHGRDFKTNLNGFEEVPAVITSAGGAMKAEINRAGDEIRYELSYRNLEGQVTQAHIHIGQEDVAGGISVWLCGNVANTPAGVQPCPPANPRASVTGTIHAADVVGPAAQGVPPGAFDDLVRAMRAGVSYANVHSSVAPTGEIRGQFDREHGRD